MALTGQAYPARFATGHLEYKILCGRVAIGASGAVTDVDTPGVSVVRTSEGLYTFTIDRAVGGVNKFVYTDVQLNVAGAIPDLAADAMLCQVASATEATGIVTALTYRPATAAAVQTALVAIALVWANGTPIANDGGAAVQTAQDTAAQALVTTVGPLESTVQDPESGSSLSYYFVVHDSGYAIPD